MDKLLNSQEVADILHLTKFGVFNLIRQGLLKRINLGNKYLFDPEEIKRFIRENQS